MKNKRLFYMLCVYTLITVFLAISVIEWPVYKDYCDEQALSAVDNKIDCEVTGGVWDENAPCEGEGCYYCSINSECVAAYETDRSRGTFVLMSTLLVALVLVVFLWWKV